MTDNIHTFGDFRFSTKTLNVTKDFNKDELIGRSPKGVAAFSKSIMATGLVIYPVICTYYKDKLYLIDGVKRVLACQTIIALKNDEIAEIPGLSPSFDRMEFQYIRAKVFYDISPDDRAAWGIILNEQRSDNEISTWLRMKKLQKDGNWDEIAKIQKLNPQRFKKLEKLNNLDEPDKIVNAFEQGQLTRSTVFELAKLGKPRQQYLSAVLDDKEKLTAADIKASKEARAAAVLSAAMPDLGLPDIAAVPKRVEMFVILLKNSNLDGPHDDYHTAKQQALEHGGELYRMIPV